jgi:hypothetical protein
MEETMKHVHPIRIRLLSVLVPLISSAACSDAGLETVEAVQLASHKTPRLLHVVATTGGALHHALRTETDGLSSWTGFGNVEGQAGEIGSIVDAEAVVSGGGLHVVAITGGDLYHTIRNDAGGWTDFGNVADQTSDVGNHNSVGLSRAKSGGTFLCTSTTAGNFYLAIRNSDGTWRDWDNVKTKTGTNPGTFTRVDCSAHVSVQIGGPEQDTLHVVGRVTSGDIWHAIRFNNDTWTVLGNVNAHTGTSTDFLDVAASVSGNELHVVGTANGGPQLHAVRFSNSTWTGFGNIASHAGDPGSETDSSTVALDDGLHVLVRTAGGGLFNTLRRNSGTWSSYSDVKAATGSSASYSRVSVAGVAAISIPH